jgi:hypothetical protein
MEYRGETTPPKSAPSRMAPLRPTPSPSSIFVRNPADPHTGPRPNGRRTMTVRRAEFDTGAKGGAHAPATSSSSIGLLDECCSDSVPASQRFRTASSFAISRSVALNAQSYDDPRVGCSASRRTPMKPIQEICRDISSRARAFTREWQLAVTEQEAKRLHARPPPFGPAIR